MKRIIVTATTIIALATTGTITWQATKPDPKTPCAAAKGVIEGIRRTAAAGNTAGLSLYGNLFRRIAAGEFTDVEGPVTPALRTELYRLAVDLEALQTTDPPVEDFPVGALSGVAIQMDTVLAVCGTPARS